MRVLLIAGGWSSEREVSLAGAERIASALASLGHQVARLDLSLGFPALAQAAQAVDFAFINLHGSPGEDGLVQAFLDRVGCPYQGSGPAGSFLALNKAAAKALFRAAELPTPDWALLTEPPATGWLPPFPLPVFVKPNLGGSSIGMSLVQRPEDMEPALDRVFAHGSEGLVEPFIQGVEVTASVLGDESLPLILIRPSKGAPFFDYQSKYVAGGAEEICPAPLPEDTTCRIQKLALAAHARLGLSGYSRADFILDSDGNPWLLEVNTLPGMTGTSLVPQAAQASGRSFEDLVAALIELGLAPGRRA